jgi:hypothetical protein
MYVCMCGRMHVCNHALLTLCEGAADHVHKYEWTVRVHALASVLSSSVKFLCSIVACIHVRTDTYIQEHIHTYTRTYVHTHMTPHAGGRCRHLHGTYTSRCIRIVAHAYECATLPCLADRNTKLFPPSCRQASAKSSQPSTVTNTNGRRQPLPGVCMCHVLVVPVCFPKTLNSGFS